MYVMFCHESCGEEGGGLLIIVEFERVDVIASGLLTEFQDQRVVDGLEDGEKWISESVTKTLG